MKVVRAVLNGGHEETYSNATRFAPTQLPRARFRQRLRPSIRLPPARKGTFLWRFIATQRSVLYALSVH
jgi:hypothetical protein